MLCAHAHVWLRGAGPILFMLKESAAAAAAATARVPKPCQTPPPCPCPCEFCCNDLPKTPCTPCMLHAQHAAQLPSGRLQPHTRQAFLHPPWVGLASMASTGTPGLKCTCVGSSSRGWASRAGTNSSKEGHSL